MPAVLRPLRPLALAAVVSLLAACGNDSSTPTTTPASGTLTDAAIAGVSYRTSSGLSGVTDADGKFRYNPGDTVTFLLGALELGPVATDGREETVTPIDLVNVVTGLDDTQKQNMVTNLLVLLQSVDADGNPENGINIPAAVSTALTSTIAGTLLDSLKNTAPADFANAGNSDLSTLVVAAGEGASIRSPEDALQHFKNQFLAQLAGTYVIRNAAANEVIAFRFAYDGSYIMGEVAAADEAGGPGVERGIINWDPASGQVTAAEIFQDSNGEWGLSHPQPDEKLYFSLDGSTLVVKVVETEGTEELRLTRVTNSDGKLVGAWALNTGMGAAAKLDVQQFLFFSDGVYLMIDPLGDTEFSEPDDPRCGDAGVEMGRYSFSSGILRATGIIEDANGCAGLHDAALQDPFSSFSDISVNLGAGGVIQGSPAGEYSVLLVDPLYQPLL